MMMVSTRRPQKLSELSPSPLAGPTPSFMSLMMTLTWTHYLDRFTGGQNYEDRSKCPVVVVGVRERTYCESSEKKSRSTLTEMTLSPCSLNPMVLIPGRAFAPLS